MPAKKAQSFPYLHITCLPPIELPHTAGAQFNLYIMHWLYVPFFL